MVSSLQEMLPKPVYTFFIFHVLIICVQLVWSLNYYTNIIIRQYLKSHVIFPTLHLSVCPFELSVMQLLKPVSELKFGWNEYCV